MGHFRSMKENLSLDCTDQLSAWIIEEKIFIVWFTFTETEQAGTKTLNDHSSAGALLQDLEFETFLKKSPTKAKFGTFLGPFLYLSGTFSRYSHKNAAKLTKSKKRL